eukprot:COSAG06_NODE_48297_length_333_cov_0.662393_1_plen_29_part_01
MALKDHWNRLEEGQKALTALLLAGLAVLV